MPYPERNELVLARLATLCPVRVRGPRTLRPARGGGPWFRALGGHARLRPLARWLPFAFPCLSEADDLEGILG